MSLSTFIVREAILPALTQTTKDGVIREMVHSLCAAGQFRPEDEEDLLKAVLRREQLGSTGIGRHIAIPHAKHQATSRLVGTLALSRQGVSFDSIDGEPVFVFVLLVSPDDQPGNHLRPLESVVRTMRDDTFVQALRQATTVDEIWKLLSETEPGWSGR